MKKKEFLRITRSRWKKLRSAQSDARTGSAFYPPEVYDWIKQFDKMDKLMKEFYKNA